MNERDFIDKWKRREQANRPDSKHLKSEIGVRNGSTAGVGR